LPIPAPESYVTITKLTSTVRWVYGRKFVNPVMNVMEMGSFTFRVIYHGCFFPFSTDHSYHPAAGIITRPSRNMCWEIIFLGLRVVLRYVEVIGLRVFPVDPGRPPAHLLGIRFNASTLYASNCALITVCRTRHDFRCFPKHNSERDCLT